VHRTSHRDSDSDVAVAGAESRTEAVLDAAEFAPGEVEMVAVATDAAGNRSAAAVRRIVIR
jgi:hypothetical protein